MARLTILSVVADGSDPDKVNDAVFVRMSMKDAVELAERAGAQFEVAHDGKFTNAYVAKSRYGRKFLKTVPNTSVSDNFGEIASGQMRLINAIYDERIGRAARNVLRFANVVPATGLGSFSPIVGPPKR